jgi:hypothetical protein
LRSFGKLQVGAYSLLVERAAGGVEHTELAAAHLYRRGFDGFARRDRRFVDFQIVFRCELIEDAVRFDARLHIGPAVKGDVHLLTR